MMGDEDLLTRYGGGPATFESCAGRSNVGQAGQKIASAFLLAYCHKRRGNRADPTGEILR